MQTPHLLPRAHEELVVAAVVLPELEEPDDGFAVEESDVEALNFEPELDDLPAVEASSAAFAIAGSFPALAAPRSRPSWRGTSPFRSATARVRIIITSVSMGRMRCTQNRRPFSQRRESRIRKTYECRGREFFDGFTRRSAGHR
jgi:hypothetical protein